MERWEKVKAVQRMQEFILAHLAEPITLHRLAQAAGYSPWYSARLFKELTDKAPFEYIRLLRLSRAALRLRDGDDSVPDVAGLCVRLARGAYARLLKAVRAKPEGVPEPYAAA